MYKVLIIDDEPLIGEGVRAKLERAGLAEIGEIQFACGGTEGLQAAAALKPHIVITDMRMPEIDGIQVIRRLSAVLPLAKFILLSGYGDYEYVREAFKYGALDYLLKPAGSPELANQIRAAIASIEADGRQAEQAERSRKADKLALASRLATILNGAVPLEPDEVTDEVRSLTDGFLIHASTAVVLFHISGTPYSAADLALAESSLERQARQAVAVGSDGLRILAFNDGDGSVCAVLNYPCTLPRDALFPLLTETVGELRRAGWLQAVASVSESGPPDDLTKLYKQAQRLLSSRILRESCEVLMPQSGNSTRELEGLMPARKDIEELRNAVDTLQLERIGQWIDRWLPDSLVGNGSLRQLKSIYELLQTEIRRRFNGWQPSEGSEQIRKLSSFQSLDELRLYLREYARYAKQIERDHAEPEDTVISVAESYVREHFNRDIQLAEMANRVSMNYSYFSKLFKEQTGLTFTAYLIKVRMEEARKLLQDPILRINEVSERVGYGNLYHFSRAFKNYFGISPKEYRRPK